MGSEISLQMRDEILKWKFVNPDDPDQNNGTKLLNYCIVIGPGQMMMIPAYNNKGCAAFLSRRESNTGEKTTSFPKKIQPCLTRDSSPNPLGYKPRVIATTLVGRHGN
ncbi:uncharacterized protein TNCV_4493971 [Trichonephila clavipes]|nr:uncharacterized protein TNCV_4493971 [Trichonephila clavipes]